MAIKITDHGIWKPYTPDPIPEWALQLSAAGGNVVFYQNDAGVDWYEYRNTKGRFSPDALFLTTEALETGPEAIQVAYPEVGYLDPWNRRVLEVLGVDLAGKDPTTYFAWMKYDPAIDQILGDGEPPTPPIVAVKDYQFAGQAAAEGIISDDDALAWVAQGKTPDRLVSAVKATVTDSDRQKRVLLFLAGTTSFPRNHELTPLLAASFGKDTPEKVDAFFLAASKR